MKVKSKRRKSEINPTVSIEFESNFELDKFIDFANNLIFDGIAFRQPIDKDKISGVGYLADFQLDTPFFVYAIGKAIEQGEPFAVWWEISDIKTDENRFQNRTDAFSELSAQSVAENYDINKLDPVVVWRDGKDNHIYMLSGHSRLEGLRRRKEKYIPVRFFSGSEADAIKFARVDANRAANKENLLEDLKAYKLMREGDLAKNISPASKKELQNIFKEKTNTLEMLSYLNPQGKFITALNENSTLPHIEKFAVWIGALRKEYGVLFTNTWESDAFNFFYSSDKGLKLTKEEFLKIIKKRIAYGKERLFPECTDQNCTDIKDFSELPPNGHLYKQIEKNAQDIERIRERLRTTDRVNRIYTDEEKVKLRDVALVIEKELEKIKKELGIIENQPVLFGIGNIQDITFVIYYKKIGNREKLKHFSSAETLTEAKREVKEIWTYTGQKLKTLNIIKSIRL